MKDRLESLELFLTAHPDCTPGSEMDDRMWDVKRMVEDLNNGVKIDILLPEERSKLKVLLAMHSMELLGQEVRDIRGNPKLKGQLREHVKKEIEFNKNLIQKLDQ